MKKTLLILIATILFAAFFVSSAQAESIVPDGVEHGEAYNINIAINADATLSVNEEIRYDFAGHEKTGIIRYIPLDYQNLNGDKIKISVNDVAVTDENGNKINFDRKKIQSEDKKKTYLAITIGEEGKNENGKKTYIINYTVNDAIKFGSDKNELFWNATGDKWPVYLMYPEVKISLPQKVEKEKITKQCFIGLARATMDCIDDLGSKKDVVADYSYKGVVAGESMTIVLDFPSGIIKKEVEVRPSLWQTIKEDPQARNMFLFKAGVLLILATLFLLNFKKIAAFVRSEKFYRALVFVGKKFKLHLVHAHAKHHAKKLKNKSRKWWISLFVFLAVIVIFIAAVFWKIEATMNKISVKGESVGSIVQATIQNYGPIKGEQDGQINVLLLGVLGANHPGGGLNTDTIMVASIRPQENKISLVSIPRDLWVLDPGKDTKSKINAVYEYGEEKGSGQGIADIETKISEITGLQIHYTGIVSTQGFTKVVDTLGGVDVNLTKPFNETTQFTDVKVCDGDTYTIPTGKTQKKKNKKGKVTAEYPLCENKAPECGGDFHLPIGKSTLSGQQALCFVRSRYETSDFERAKRQQLILQQVKTKASQLNITDFGKVSEILDNLGDNVQTDMQLWEMRKLFDIYKGMDNAKIYQRVLEDSKEGLLYAPDATPATGYILLPRGDSYDKIHDLFQNIFNDGSKQSDVKPKI